MPADQLRALVRGTPATAPADPGEPDAPAPSAGELARLEAYYVALLEQLEIDQAACRSRHRYRELSPLIAQHVRTREALADLRARAARAAPPTGERPAVRLRRQLVQLEHSIAQQEARSRPDGQALAALLRRRDTLEERLAEAERAERELPTSPEQLREAVIRLGDQMTDDLIEILMRLYAARHEGRVRLLFEQGRQSELVEDGWRQVDAGTDP